MLQSVSLITVWNDFSLDIQKSSSISLFKTKLKTHYFNMAFIGVPDIDWYASTTTKQNFFCFILPFRWYFFPTFTFSYHNTFFVTIKHL